MSHLSKLALSRIVKPKRADPVASARQRILADLSIQHEVVKAVMAGTDYKVPTKRRRIGPDGTRVQYDTEKRVQAWFFPLNGGWYAQCKLGSRPLSLDGDKNAVFVGELAKIVDVLNAFKLAVEAGELDAEFFQRKAPEDQGEQTGKSKLQVPRKT